MRFTCSASLSPSFIISCYIMSRPLSFPSFAGKKDDKDKKGERLHESGRACLLFRSQGFLVSAQQPETVFLSFAYLHLHLNRCTTAAAKHLQPQRCVCPYLLVPGGPSRFSLRLCGHSQQVLLTLVMVIRTKQIIGLKLCSCFLLLPAAAACPLIASLLSWDQCAHTHLTQTHTRARAPADPHVHDLRGHS